MDGREDVAGVILGRVYFAHLRREFLVHVRSLGKFSSDLPRLLPASFDYNWLNE